MAHATCDIQMLRGKDGEFVIKEFSVCHPLTLEVDTVLFLPPYSDVHLPVKYQRVNHWLKNHFHGLNWECGGVPYSCLKRSLSWVMCPYDILYVKGEEKTQLLRTLLPGIIFINIERLGCPKLDALPCSDVTCYYTQHFCNKTLSCAPQNAKKMTIWLQNYLAMKFS